VSFYGPTTSNNVVDPDSHGSALIWTAGSGSGPAIPMAGGKIPTTIEKTLKKVKKFHSLKCWMLSVEGWRLLLSFGRPSCRPRDKKLGLEINNSGLEINKVQFLYKKLGFFQL
jgi:hypothetical protein